DNWRLSAARAQSAYYMLVRGGLEEERVKQISGFADRRLQVPNDAYAPANRRIEILLQSGQG
ncbi:MotB family protein, partial [Sinorhizobium meliloti]